MQMSVFKMNSGSFTVEAVENIGQNANQLGIIKYGGCFHNPLATSLPWNTTAISGMRDKGTEQHI